MKILKEEKMVTHDIPGGSLQKKKKKKKKIENRNFKESIFSHPKWNERLLADMFQGQYPHLNI